VGDDDPGLRLCRLHDAQQSFEDRDDFRVKPENNLQ
jgi:hypothetical protein